MLTVAVQAGGKSLRMGEDKALTPFLGQPMIIRILKRVLNVADEVLVTTNSREPYQFLKVKLVPDLIRERGALGGLYTAMSAAQQPFVAIIACDMPFVSSGLLKAELDLLVSSESDAVIPHTEAGLEPFHGVYRCNTCLPHVQDALNAGEWRVDAWFSKIKMQPMSLAESKRYDPDTLAFINVNSIEELKKAERIASDLSGR